MASLGARISSRAARATAKLDRRRTLLGLIVLAVGAFLAYVAFISTTGPPFQGKYELEVEVPADSPVLRVGQAVRIGGKLAGLISAVEPDRENGGTTVVANITKTEFRPLPADTRAYVRVHSIVYETYLELRPGNSDGDLASRDRVTRPATSGVDLLEVVQLFDAETRRALRDNVVNTGFGLAGRGAGLNEALADVPALSRRLSTQLDAITPRRGVLSSAVGGAADTTSGLRGVRSDDVGALIRSGADAFGTVAGRPEELRRTIRLLPGFEDQFISTSAIAEPLFDQVAALSSELRAPTQAVRSQLPDLNRLLALGGVLRTEVDLIADVADPVLAAARPVIYGLFPMMTALTPLNRDLVTLKATVEPYKPEIRQAGVQFSNATSVRIPEGIASGAPALRVVPVLTSHPCLNPLPDAGEAQGDKC